MEQERIRNYSSILTRLERSLDGTGNLTSLGTLTTPKETYSLKKIVLGSGNAKRVLISAGIHGDEPAAVETICAFLERKEFQEYVKQWEVTLLPCLNPFGYEHGLRENHEARDLNRLFKSGNPPTEVILAQSLFQKFFHLTLELHEDVDSPGYYLYQKTSRQTDKELGYKIVEKVRPLMPINTSGNIEGIPAINGVIERLADPEEMDWWPMALYAVSKGTRCCFTLETSTRFPMETRVNAHLAALRTALKHCTDES